MFSQIHTITMYIQNDQFVSAESSLRSVLYLVLLLSVF